MNSIYLISRAKVAGPVNQALNILYGHKLNGRVNSKLVTLSKESENDTWLERFKNTGIEYFQMNCAPWAIWKCSRILKKYVTENNIQVVHSSGTRANIVNILGHGAAKTITTQRHLPRLVESVPRMLNNFFSTIDLEIIKRMDAVVACSKSIQEAFKESENMDVEVVQNGVNTDFFVPVSKDEKQSKKAVLGLNPSITTYLVLGVLLPRKNNTMIIEAFTKSNLLNAQLVFVGDGAQKEELKVIAGNNDNIIFAGKTTTPIDYLHASDILVSASLAEGLPNTVLEALSCGLPCILSDIEPHKELIENTHAGILFNKESETELKDCFIQSSHWNLDEMSKVARKVATENFGLRSLAYKYETIYNNVIK